MENFSRICKTKREFLWITSFIHYVSEKWGNEVSFQSPAYFHGFFLQQTELILLWIFISDKIDISKDVFQTKMLFLHKNRYFHFIWRWQAIIEFNCLKQIVVISLSPLQCTGPTINHKQGEGIVTSETEKPN